MGRPLKEVGFSSGPSDSPVLSRDAVITQGEGLDLQTDGFRSNFSIPLVLFPRRI